MAGDSYVYVYCGTNNKIIQQSKGLGEVNAEKILPVCTRIDGRAVFKYLLTNVFKTEGINAQLKIYTRTIRENYREIQQKFFAGKKLILAKNNFQFYYWRLFFL